MIEGILVMLDMQERLEKLSNDQLAHLLLEHAPLFGYLSMITEEAAKRLSPGILDLDDVTPSTAPTPPLPIPAPPDPIRSPADPASDTSPQ